ncbi:hypothetical protein [Cellvibrio sp. PSBB023]|uniref:hypothetical protein n=1 Tax=Cellvibrio sp. PSBB023 TaxID=1945512 RepID=UPI00098F57C5|nr:hypothetical protein [Cellvibrio sp. PSBB023]AQT58745.1 hypothetical protein B0D95_00535 [Cellvibrio sp. PSBB023]
MERTLFVFEGERLEKLYFQSLERAFFDGQQSRILVSFKNDIYELYKQLNAEDDLDPFDLIKELNPLAKNMELLTNLRRDQISQIYLFFDMEPHDQQFDPQKLLDMLALFDNETEQGKLFISYPMIEAIRDINDHIEYLTRTARLDDCAGKHYKPLSAERGNPIYQDARKINKPVWQGLISVNLQKANYLISGSNDQTPVIDQQLIAQAQLDQFVPRGEISILAAFPIFLADYFGSKVLISEE